MEDGENEEGDSHCRVISSLRGSGPCLSVCRSYSSELVTDQIQYLPSRQVLFLVRFSLYIHVLISRLRSPRPTAASQDPQLSLSRIIFVDKSHLSQEGRTL